MVRRLAEDETAALLALDTVAHFSTLDDAGYPVVIPIWFLWRDNAFHFASDTNQGHVSRVLNDSRAGVVIDTEAVLRPDGERPNQQVRAIGHATVEPDTEGTWSARIWQKYGADPTRIADRLAGRSRSVIHLAPTSIIAVASV